MAADKKNIKLIAQNKKAYHDYFILETFQAGIALTGTEVKSMRAGRCNLKDNDTLFLLYSACYFENIQYIWPHLAK